MFEQVEFYMQLLMIPILSNKSHLIYWKYLESCWKYLKIQQITWYVEIFYK